MTDIEMNGAVTEAHVRREEVDEPIEKDMVKVVRCKKCMFFTPNSGWCNIHMSRFTDGDFCSYGRKK